jgi:hypothetical protein
MHKGVSIVNILDLKSLWMAHPLNVLFYNQKLG